MAKKLAAISEINIATVRAELQRKDSTARKFRRIWQEYLEYLTYLIKLVN